MAVYAIGDIHGCWEAFQELLGVVGFDPRRDRLWLVGDLINRGPHSLEVVQYVRGLGDRAITLMGNHEMRAVGVLSGWTEPSRHFSEALTKVSAAETASLLTWLRGLPLWHWDRDLGYAMVHGGILPGWEWAEAEARALAVAAAFQDPVLGRALYQRDGALPEGPPAADSSLGLPFDLAVLTSLRLCQPDGRLLWPGAARAAGLPDGYQLPLVDFPYQPWFYYQRPVAGRRLLYGHWAAAGLTVRDATIGLDSGCVYGGHLTAWRLDGAGEDGTRCFQVPCPRHVVPEGANGCGDRAGFACST